jgi:hypothetical protein
VKFDEVAANYVALRDAKAEMEREHEEALRPIKEAMLEAEQAMLGQLNTMGVNSLRTSNGTITKVKRTTVSVGDWDTSWKFIEENKMWHFLEHRLSKSAVEGYINEHGEPPPGANVTSMFTVQFRRN